MSNEMITIEAQVRQETGKGYARKLRRAGKIPAVLLDRGKATSLELDPKLLSKVWQAGKRCQLSVDGASRPVVIHEVQLDAVRREARHVDFKVVD